MLRLIVTSALAAFLLCIPLLSTAQPEDTPPVDPKARVAELKEESSRSYENGEFVAFYVANMKLHEMQPFVPEYMQNIVLACAQLDRRTNAYHFMLKMQQQGLSYDFNQIEGTENIRGSEAYGYMNKLMIEAGQPAGEGEIAFSLAGDPVDFSAIEWDAGRDSFLVGTRAEGKVLAVTPDGEESVLLKAGPDNGMLMVTHYQRILEYVKPDIVHVFMEGRIVRTGGSELPHELETKGYDWLLESSAAGSGGAS